MARPISCRLTFVLFLLLFTLVSPRWEDHSSGVAYAQAGHALPNLPAPQTQSLTLSRSRDYRHVGGNVDCPNCKDLYCASIQPPVAGTRLVSTQYKTMRGQGHWYRCQVQAKCGRAEFSDPGVPEQDCVGKQSCYVCRATDDATEAEDDIVITYQ
jgi:hypothetical protein